ncbi:hypothetical protein G7046_g7941 [Stylonectria norvegica]|nr:hypothetical protein G7046_g7941 [Stylonectria norvegica]
MVMLRPLLVFALALPLATSSPCRPLDCNKPEVYSFASTVLELGVFDAFCTSYMHYDLPIATETITQSYTYDDVSYIYTTDGTVTYLEEAITSVSATETVTRTIGFYPDIKQRDLELAKRAPDPKSAPAETPDAVEKVTPETTPELAPSSTFETVSNPTVENEILIPPELKPDYNGGVLGFDRRDVGDACSCLAPQPPPTATETSYIGTTITVLYTETIPEFTTTSTSTFTAHDYTYVSIVYTKTYSSPTDCGDAAHPTFFVQMRDVNPDNSNQWNNNYLATRESIYRSDTIDPDAIVVAETSKQLAVLVTIEPGTGYLRTVNEGWYLNSDPYNNFQLMFFNSREVVDTRHYNYHVCSIVQTGSERELKCTVPENPWVLHVYQTCALYVQYYDTPMVAGESWSAESPTCYEKKFYIVDACN